MVAVKQRRVPDEALLKTYQGGPQPEAWRDSGDCFEVPVNRVVSLAEFVFAFYTTWVFKLERVIVKILVDSPSTDEEARRLALGAATSFVVWRVGERTATQLLMCDRSERTRSWFRVVSLTDGMTLLQFGSAVPGEFPWLLLKFHVFYSHVLLHAAKRRLIKLAGRI